MTTGGASGYRPSLLDLADPSVRASYLELWETSARRTPFEHPSLVEASCRAYGFTGRLAVAADEEGGWHAAVPAFVRRRGPFEIAATPPLVPYLSPVLRGVPGLGQVHERRSPLDTLATCLGDLGQATLLFPPDAIDARPFSWAGWSLESRYTLVTDVPGGADPASWRPTRRRHAANAASEYEVVEDLQYVQAAAAFSREAMERHGRPLIIPAGAEVALATALSGAGLARTFAAVPSSGGPPDAVATFAVDGERAWYWIVGSRPGSVMSALVAHALTSLAASGVKTVDWCGANAPTVADFKASFAGRLAPTVRARWQRPGLLRLLGRLRGG